MTNCNVLKNLDLNEQFKNSIKDIKHQHEFDSKKVLVKIAGYSIDFSSTNEFSKMRKL